MKNLMLRSQKEARTRVLNHYRETHQVCDCSVTPYYTPPVTGAGVITRSGTSTVVSIAMGPNQNKIECSGIVFL